MADIPNFDFSAFYYPQILEALLRYKRANLPELTDESDVEPSIQFLRSFALVGHLNNVLLDQVANESILATARLPESVRHHLRLIGYEMASATPARVDIVANLNRDFSAAFDIMPPLAQVSTRRTGSDQPLYYEVVDGYTLSPTNVVGYVYGYDGATYSDDTAAAQAATEWSLASQEGAMLYIGHPDVMWNQVDLAITVPADVAIGVWEFYDGDFQSVLPDGVTLPSAGTLEFDLTTLLGTFNRTGAVVRVRLEATGAYEDVVSYWDGTKNVCKTTLIGQSSPSLVASDYRLGTDWKELPDAADATAGLAASGSLTFTLPQSETLYWKTTTINGASAYWIRYRIIAVNSTGTAKLTTVTQTGVRSVLASAVQGRSAISETLGSSTGAEDQSFTTQQTNFIAASQTVYVDGQAWTEVSNFLSSTATDQHYRVELGEDDVGTIIFGNGSQGKIPPIGQNNITIDYRYGADADGNVGANTITVDKTGLTYVDSLYNPRQAAGWAQAESANDSTLAIAKIKGPAALRAGEVAIGPDDATTLTINYVDANGVKPFSRAKPIEEGFGPKTIKMVVVARGGGSASQAELDDLSAYFNGDATLGYKKRIVANQQLTAVNYSKRSVDVTATVYAKPGVSTQQVENALIALLNPEALKSDGVTPIWDFGGSIPKTRISHEIYNVDSKVSNVVLTYPAGDTLLGSE